MKVRPKLKYLFRAVSYDELVDIQTHGLRNKLGAYETGKLFALNVEDACRFGKNNFLLDGLSNTLIKARVPVEVYHSSVQFVADGMTAILIEKECLNLLSVTSIDFSPTIQL